MAAGTGGGKSSTGGTKMSAQSNKTIWTVAMVALIGYLVWKLLPVVSKKLGTSGTASTGSAVGGSSSPYSYRNPYTSSSGSSGSGSQRASDNSQNIGTSSSTWNRFVSAVNQSFQDSLYGPNQIHTTEDYSYLPAADTQIASIPYQLFDVSQMATDVGSSDSYLPLDTTSYDSSADLSLDTDAYGGGTYGGMSYDDYTSYDNTSDSTLESDYWAD